MNKIATISIKTTSLVYEYITFFGFVFGVYLRILSQLVASMGELAFLLIWTGPILNEFFAKLALLLVLSHIRFRECFKVISRGLLIVGRYRGKTIFAHIF